MVGLKVKDVQGPFLDEPYIGGISDAGILNVNQGILRTEILQSLMGFSEEFMDYGIDPDLTARVLYAGHDIVYTKDIAILHYRDWGESEVLHAQFEKQDRYKALYWEKHVHVWSKQGLNRSLVLVAGGVKRFVRLSSRLVGSAWADRWYRDWYNIVWGRYISLLDPIRSMGREFHLLQRCDPETIMYHTDRLHQGGK